MRKTLGLILAVTMMVGLVTPAASQSAKKTTLSKKKCSITVGEKVTLSLKNAWKKSKITWKTKNKKIATVSKKGLVKAKKAGSTKILCQMKKKKKSKIFICRITVKKALKKSTSTPVNSTNKPTSTPVNQTIATPSPAPTAITTTYHKNWPSTYQDEYTPLKELCKGHFKLGAAIAGSDPSLTAILDSDMRGILQKHFNSTTSTNMMKPVNLLNQAKSQAASDGMPVVTFEKCEQILQFCKDTGIALRGHVLVWYNQTPDWFFREGYQTDGEYVTKAVMKTRMESYIKSVITYVQTNYPGVVYCWDVVNEAIADDGTDRTCTWYDIYGSLEYVKDAFTFARKYADDGVKLIYNDYNTFVSAKTAGILRLINYVNSDSKLIDGIGMQSPLLQEWPSFEKDDSGSDVQTAIEAFAKTKLELMITELCVRTEGGNTPLELARQAQRYKEFFNLLLKEDTESGGPANITSVTLFGISDSYRLYDDSNWSDNDPSRYAWFWNKDCQPKAAFKAVYHLFENWRN